MSVVCSPGGGGFFSFAAAGSSSREGEAFSAPSSPVLAPEGKGSHSSTLSVLGPRSLLGFFFFVFSSLDWVKFAVWFLVVRVVVRIRRDELSVDDEALQRRQEKESRVLESRA